MFVLVFYLVMLFLCCFVVFSFFRRFFPCRMLLMYVVGCVVRSFLFVFMSSVLSFVVLCFVLLFCYVFFCSMMYFFISFFMYLWFIVFACFFLSFVISLCRQVFCILFLNSFLFCAFICWFMSWLFCLFRSLFLWLVFCFILISLFSSCIWFVVSSVLSLAVFNWLINLRIHIYIYTYYTSLPFIYFLNYFDCCLAFVFFLSSATFVCFDVCVSFVRCVFFFYLFRCVSRLFVHVVLSFVL